MRKYRNGKRDYFKASYYKQIYFNFMYILSKIVAYNDQFYQHLVFYKTNISRCDLFKAVESQFITNLKNLLITLLITSGQLRSIR